MLPAAGQPVRWHLGCRWARPCRYPASSAKAGVVRPMGLQRSRMRLLTWPASNRTISVIRTGRRHGYLLAAM